MVQTKLSYRRQFKLALERARQSPASSISSRAFSFASGRLGLSQAICIHLGQRHAVPDNLKETQSIIVHYDPIIINSFLMHNLPTFHTTYILLHCIYQLSIKDLGPY